MSHYLDGEDGKIFLKMYKGRAFGVSFPTDGNRHNDSWTNRKYPVIIAGVEKQITINTYEDGAIISIEVDLPENITNLETSLS